MTFVIIEDDFSISEIILNFIEETGAYKNIGVFENPVDFLEAKLQPDLVILDIQTPKLNGLEALPLILDQNPNADVIINSIIDDVDIIFKALQLGAIGYFDKQSGIINISEVIECVRNGGAFMTPSVARKVVTFFQSKNNIFSNLTKKEKAVCNSILDGLSYKLIANKHNIELNTVRMHIKNIYRKLKVNSKAELFLLSGKKFFE
jgi:DNA-binding NarL/FixJ family response regulator